MLAVIDNICLRRVKLCSQRVWKYYTTLDSVWSVSFITDASMSRVCNGIWYPSETPIQRVHMCWARRVWWLWTTMHNVQEFENHNSAVVLLETMYVLSSPVLLKKENVFIENKEKKRQKRYVKLLRKHLKGFPAVVSACWTRAMFSGLLAWLSPFYQKHCSYCRLRSILSKVLINLFKIDLPGTFMTLYFTRNAHFI